MGASGGVCVGFGIGSGWDLVIASLIEVVPYNETLVGEDFVKSLYLLYCRFPNERVIILSIIPLRFSSGANLLFATLIIFLRMLCWWGYSFLCHSFYLFASTLLQFLSSPFRRTWASFINRNAWRSLFWGLCIDFGAYHIWKQLWLVKTTIKFKHREFATKGSPFYRQISLVR